MYQALEAAAQAVGKQVVLVECGWHANEFIAKAYADAAKLACPSVRVVTLDGRKAEDRQTAWAGADVFCSLSDNIQETFGIVPTRSTTGRRSFRNTKPCGCIWPKFARHKPRT
ncbi:MAG: hypothetical protein Q8L56_15155 [Rhodocyclaceae bacterium]|nr:hypothetical protein [Rhodocyclaceae bacterium]